MYKLIYILCVLPYSWFLLQIEINIVEMLAGLIIGACATNAKNKSCPIITTVPAYTCGRRRN